MSGALATATVDWPEGSAVEELPPLPEHDVNVSTGGQIAADIGEIFAAVRRFENVRLIIIELVTVKSDIGDLFADAGRLNVRDSRIGTYT